MKLFHTNKQLFRFSLFGLYAAIVLEPHSSIAAPLAKLKDWRFYPEAVQLEITLSAGTTPRYFYLSQPPRVVVDLPDTKLGYVPTQQSYPGVIPRIRVSQLNASVTRIVLDLAAGTYVDPNQIQLQPVSRQNPTRWVLRPLITSYQPTLQPSPNNTPANSYNYSPQPSNLTPSNYLQLPSTLPQITNQQPFISVPPLTPSNSSQLPNSTLPPATFPNQPNNLQNTPATTSPDFPVPTIPHNSAPNESNVEVIEFGQPLPKGIEK